jgi:hypothetical protein
VSVESYTAKEMLAAVEQWAFPDYWMMRETAACAPAGGRLDGLLIPVSIQSPAMKSRGFRSGYWTERAVPVGVEIKASRADFRRGLNEGQFARYAEAVPNLFVCTGRDVATSEIPEGVGHLVHHCPPGEQQTMNGCRRRTTNPEPRIVCRRQPKFRPHEMDADTMWRIVLYCADEVREAQREREREQRALFEKLATRFAGALRAATQ